MLGRSLPEGGSIPPMTNMEPGICRKCGAEILTRRRFQIQARKGVCYTFCSSCFDILKHKSNKDVRAVIKKNKVWR